MSDLSPPPDSPLVQTLHFLLGAALIAVALAGYALGWWHEATAEEFTVTLIGVGGGYIAKRRTDARKLRELRRQTEQLERLNRKV